MSVGDRPFRENIQEDRRIHSSSLLLGLQMQRILCPLTTSFTSNTIVPQEFETKKSWLFTLINISLCVASVIRVDLTQILAYHNWAPKRRLTSEKKVLCSRFFHEKKNERYSLSNKVIKETTADEHVRWSFFMVPIVLCEGNE